MLLERVQQGQVTATNSAPQPEPGVCTLEATPIHSVTLVPSCCGSHAASAAALAAVAPAAPTSSLVLNVATLKAPSSSSICPPAVLGVCPSCTTCAARTAGHLAHSDPSCYPSKCALSHANYTMALPHLCAGQDGVNVLLVQRLPLALLRRLVLFEQVLRAKAQDGGQLVLRGTASKQV